MLIVPEKTGEPPETKPMGQREVKIGATEQFRKELDQIREYIQQLLGRKSIEDLDNCRKEIIKLSEDDQSVLKHQKGFILATASSDQTTNIKKAINESINRISRLLKPAIDIIFLKPEEYLESKKSETMEKKIDFSFIIVKSLPLSKAYGLF